MAAAKIKVIELAKELGVTSKDLILAAEEWAASRQSSPASPGEAAPVPSTGTEPA